MTTASATRRYWPRAMIGLAMLGAFCWYATRQSPTTDEPPPAQNQPSDEQAFVSAVQAARSVYRAGSNEMASGAARPARAQAICRLLAQSQNGERSVANWIGRIDKLSSTNSGAGVLSVEIGPDVTLSTLTMDIVDRGDRSTLVPNSPAFTAVAQQKAGDMISFSGSFFPSDDDCVEELSVTQEGSMEQPAFEFRFAQIRTSP